MKSLRIKVFLGVLFGLLLVTAVAEILLYRQAAAFAEKELFSSLRKYAVALTDAGYANSVNIFTLYPDWASRLKISPEDRSQFFEFKTMDGQYITDSHNLGGDSLPDVGVHQGQRLIDYGNVVLGVYEHQFDIFAEGQPPQKLRLIVADNTDFIRDARKSVLRTLLLFTPLAFIAAFLISLALTTATLSSISRFTRQVQAYSRTNSRSRLRLRSFDKELQPLGEALNKHIYQLNQHTNLESKLLADTAHELHTPLRVMRKELDQLMQARHSPSELALHAEKLDNNLSGLQTMADNMLLLYRIESGNFKPKIEPVELSSEIEAIAHPYRDNRKVDIEISGERTTIPSNRSVVNLIITRLLKNAVQHANGAKISIRWESGLKTVELHVDDAGAGIPESERESIFDRHYRLHGHKQSGTSGTGLGLALVRLYANSVGATTLCTGSPLGGARFTVLFPVKQEVGALTDNADTSNTQGEAA